MTLLETNQQLLLLLEDLEKVLPLLQKAEFAFDKRYHNCILNSGMGTALLKEAEAKEICIEEGLFEPLAELKLKARLLWNKKDILLEYSHNLRAMALES